MVKWAKKYGMVVMMHTGGTSIPGSTTVPADDVIAADPDIVSHINGGPRLSRFKRQKNWFGKPPYFRNRPLWKFKDDPGCDEDCQRGEGNPRIIIGNDAPSGTGVIPLEFSG